MPGGRYATVSVGLQKSTKRRRGVSTTIYRFSVETDVHKVSPAGDALVLHLGTPYSEQVGDDADAGATHAALGKSGV